MSVLADRAAVAQQLALRELDPDFRAWLERHPGVTDAEGAQVICAFAEYEPAETLFNEAIAHPHPVIVASEIDLPEGRGLIMCQLTEQLPEPQPNSEVLNITDELTVADVFRAFRRLDGRRGLVLQFAGDRSLVLA